MQFFHLLVLLEVGHVAVADQNHVTLTLNGGKDVPIRGFLLSENKACDNAKMDDTRIMNKLNSIENRIDKLDKLGSKMDGLKNNLDSSAKRFTALETSINEVKKAVTDLQFSSVPGTGIFLKHFIDLLIIWIFRLHYILQFCTSFDLLTFRFEIHQ